MRFVSLNREGGSPILINPETVTAICAADRVYRTEAYSIIFTGTLGGERVVEGTPEEVAAKLMGEPA